MPTIEGEAVVEPKEVEVGEAGQATPAETDMIWALATSPLSYTGFHKWLRAFSGLQPSEAGTERNFGFMRPIHPHHRASPHGTDDVV